MTSHRIRFALILLHLMVLPALGQQRSPPTPGESPRAEVLVLGVYHMANPGRDIFNMQADDVLAPKRQAEIEQLVNVLKTFQPTKIAVERDFNDSRVSKSYADYLAGTHELTHNEVQQIGFRLAKELNHENIYPVDADGEFPFQHVVNYAKASGRATELDGVLSEIGAMVEAQNDYLASHTLLETLLYMNADRKVADDMGFYYRQAEFGEPWDWAGADLVSSWFRRNMRIYSNVMGLIQEPDERVLVIFGAGHLGWLQHAFSNNPRLRLRKLSELAE